LPFNCELDAAIRLAREAGEIVKTFYQVPLTVRWKEPSEPVTEADRAANAYLVKQIATTFPEDGLLAEESKDDLSRLEKKRVWVIDPLDGTLEFIARNGQFCIMIGLVVDGIPSVGVVFQPEHEVLYAAVRGGGAFIEEFGERWPLRVSKEADTPRLRPVVSRSHRPAILDGMLKALGVQKERVVGSAGLKIALLARGQAEFYLHPAAGPKEWDTCAAEVILCEAGGVMTDCWNRPLAYNQRDVRRPFGVVASNGVCHTKLVEAITCLLDDAGVDPEFGF
jgi:3'(2'), 5'-bisphosphate nucleotidase